MNKSRRVLKNILYIVSFFVIGCIGSYIGMIYFEETLLYIDTSQVPDTPTAFLMGGFLAFLVTNLFNFYAMSFFAIVINLKGNAISLKSAVITEVQGKAQKNICIVGYALTAIAVLNIIKDFHIYGVFIPLSVPYFVLFGANIMMYVVLLNSWLMKRENPN